MKDVALSKRLKAQREELCHLIVTACIDATAEIMAVAPSDILSRGRSAAIYRARMAVYHAARDYFTGRMQLSFPEIARAANRDHSSIVHARDKSEGLIVKDMDFRRLVARILSTVKTKTFKTAA